MLGPARLEEVPAACHDNYGHRAFRLEVLRTTIVDRKQTATMPMMPSSVPMISGRGQPYQERQEMAVYRVVHQPTVAVRDRPWGSVIGAKKADELVPTCARSVGLAEGTWVKTTEEFEYKGARTHGWMLVHGQAINLGQLLDKVEKDRMGMVVRYQVMVAKTDIRERPVLAGVPVVGARKKGDIIRTDQQLNGWVRLQHDFYAMGKADPLEGWAQIDGHAIGQGLILQRWDPPTLPAAVIGGLGAHGGQTQRYWVLAAEGVPVRESSEGHGRPLMVSDGH